MTIGGFSFYEGAVFFAFFFAAVRLRFAFFFRFDFGR
jgi:hypothetical protein